MKRVTLVCVLALLAASPTMIFAQEAPVVDVQEDVDNTQVDQNGAVWKSMAPDGAEANTGRWDAPVDRVSQQVTNIVRMNLPQQIDELRAKVSQLEGRLEVAERSLKLLSEQQARFYEDLSVRIQSLDAKKTPAKHAPITPKSTDIGAYQQAFKLLAKKDFSGAEKGFAHYVKQYPKGQFAANAYFWMGELALKRHANAEALKSFKYVVAHYPKSPKVGVAKLKIARLSPRSPVKNVTVK